MGNGNSSYVQIDNPACLPGDLISGHIHVNIVSMVTCTGVYIKVSGKESVRLTRRRHTSHHKRKRRGSAHHEKVTYFGGRSIFKL